METPSENIVGGACAVNSFITRSTIPWIMAVRRDVVRQVLADVDVTLRDVQRDMSWILLVSIGTGLLAAEMLAPAKMTLPFRSS